MTPNCKMILNEMKMRKETKRKPLAKIVAALILCCLMAGTTAWGQSRVKVESTASDSKSVVLEVFGAQDATVSATPVERTSPNGEKLFCAYDINITKDGREWQPQPEEPAIVTMTDPNFVDGQLLDIYHEGKDGLEYVATVASENGQITFPAPSFSVYIVTESGDYARLKVTFHRADGSTISLYVKKADIGQGDYNTIVYNPGMGTVPAGVACKGWTTNAAYGVADIASALTFAGVRTTIQTWLNAGITDGTERHFYTMLFKSYSITYLDEEGAVVNTNDVAYRADAPVPPSAYEVNAAYIPSDNDHNFEGWKVNTHADGAHISGHSNDEHVYENGDDITVTGSVTFKVYVTKGHWLIYHENGKGATYKAADFVRSGENTVAPTLTMVRNGYTFDGWWTGEPTTEGGDPTGSRFTFGGPLNENTHVYAKWNPSTRAPYTVIIWKQNVDGTGYDFERYISLEGQVGSYINTVSQQSSGNDAYARVNGTDYQYTGFHLDDFDRNVTIATEGNSVLNVYYDRTEYVLKFQDYTYTRNNNGGYVYWPGGYYRYNGTYYYFPEGYYSRSNSYNTAEDTYGVGPSPVRNVDNNTNVTYYTQANNGSAQTYRAYRYDRSANRTTIKEIRAVYGKRIIEEFPIVGSNGMTYDDGQRWHPATASTTFSSVIVVVEIMPAENVTFYMNPGARRALKTMNWYVEALPGTTGTITATNPLYNYNYQQVTPPAGKNYVLYNSKGARYHGVDNADFMEISGFQRLGANRYYGVYNGNTYYVWNNSTSGDETINFFYLREVYPISFWDGAYYDGNGNRLTSETDRGLLHTEENIAYEADVSSYNSYSSIAVPTGFVFEGWYVDKLCQQPYTFTTMPKGGITVYAKWRQIQYRVFLHPGIDEARAPRLTWGSSNQAMNFRITYNGRISAPTGIDQDDNWKFVGWFTDAACMHPFNETAIVLNDGNTVPYNKSTDLTDDMDIWGVGATWNSDIIGNNGNDRFWITQKYDLYGKWKAALPGAIGITVVYDGNGGTPASDTATHKYQDDVDAIARTACTPPDATKEFSHWVMQRYNTSTRVFEDIPGSRIYPADPFTVLKSNSKSVITAWCDPTNPSDIRTYDGPNPYDPYSTTPPDGTHTLVDSAIYTLMLRAEYVDIEQPEHTFITWYKNDGTGAIVRADKETTTPHTLDINKTVTEFDGTTPTIPAAPTRTGYTFKGWYKQRTEPGNTVPTTIQQCAPNFLYYSNNKYYKESTFTNQVTKVAADLYEKDDYLYAIWEPIIDFNFDPICQGSQITLPYTNIFGIELTGTWTAASGTVSGSTYTAPDAASDVLTFTPSSPTCGPATPFNVTIHPRPTASIAAAASNPICPGADPMKIYGATTTTTANYNYTWDGGGLTLTGGGHTWDKTRDTTVATIPTPPTCDQNYTVKLKVTDGNGCQDSTTITVIVKDDTAPTYTRPINITLYKDANCLADSSAVAGKAGYPTNILDNCGGATTVSWRDSEKTTTCKGSYYFTRTWRVVDACGNISTSDSIQTITVLDTIRPTYTRPANITLYKNANCLADSSATAGKAGYPTAISDNCDDNPTVTWKDS
ncbi:MAG: InlB B-repeat-containing protein, partial [Bacteroidales bacterium]|nr:InlB B-repeat-containing protein [Bacteroidales bacterium]